MAQALGADYTHQNGKTVKAGTIGTVGCTSFFPSKNLGCYGDGGAMYTNDTELGKRLKMIANHGQSKQYVHDEIGVNSRLDSIQAAVLNVKLKHLDEFAKARNYVANFYDKAFAGNNKITTPVRAINSTHVFHQYTLVLAEEIDRDKLKEFLATKEIPAMVYYPKPLHHQKAYTNSNFSDKDFPVTINLCKKVISLPMHTELNEETLKYITDNVLAFVTKG